MDDGLCTDPVIESTLTFGKELRVLGRCFASGAQVLLNGKSQKKTFNDLENPTRVLINNKAGKKIRPGDRLQVRNPNGTLSEEFIYGCTYNLSIFDTSFPEGGGSGSVHVTTQSGCVWQATSNASWIIVTSGSNGNGNGTVGYFVSANDSTVSRTGTLTIAGQTFSVTQAGGARANLQIVIHPPSVSQSAGSCEGVRPAWNYSITVIETAGVGINIHSIAIDYFDGNGNYLNTQTETGAFFASLFNDCVASGGYIPPRASACGDVCTHLGGLSNGSALWIFFGIDDRGNNLAFTAGRVFLLGPALASNRVLNPGFFDGLRYTAGPTPYVIIPGDARHPARTGSWDARPGRVGDLGGHADQAAAIPANAAKAYPGPLHRIISGKSPGLSFLETNRR
jgi:hypothetical protein